MTTSRRTALLALLAIVIITAVACARVASTHAEFSITVDEPIHIAAGYDWLTGAPYTFDIEHPPLTRLAFSAPLVWKNTPRPPYPDKFWWKRGMYLLEYGNEYRTRLVTARRGNLIFLVIGIAGVAAYAWRRLGPLGAAIAALLFSMLPPVLAHAGFTTTDMGGTSIFPWALLALERWIDKPNLARAIVFGIAIGLGIAAKFSFIPFFGASALIVLAARSFRPNKTAIASLLVAFFIVWGMYRFEVGTLEKSYSRGMEMVQLLSPWHARPVAEWAAKTIVLPAPNFLHGMMDVALHNRRGHPSFLLGEYNRHGWWYYFAVALAVKTPLAYLALMLAGAVQAIRRREWILPAMALAMLFITFRVQINIGVRHVMPIYIPMTILAADAVLRARGLWRIAAATLVAGNIYVSAMAHPDYLPWFNVLAGREPYRVLVDSNYDWAQDGVRLARLCRQLGIKELLNTHFVMLEPTLPPNRYLEKKERLSDQWIAVSDPAPDYLQKHGWVGVADFARATRRYRVGKTTTLMYIPRQ